MEQNTKHSHTKNRCVTFSNWESFTLIEDAKRHIAKSVVIPYAIYKKLQEKLEEELYLLENAHALDAQSYEDFLHIEEIAEDLIA